MATKLFHFYNNLPLSNFWRHSVFLLFTNRAELDVLKFKWNNLGKYW